MANFDDAGLYYQVRLYSPDANFFLQILFHFSLQERFFANDGVPDAGREMIAEYRQICEQFRRFIREFSTGGIGGLYYRCRSKAPHAPRKIPSCEAARTVADELTAPRPEGEEEMKDIQISLTLDEYPTSIRRVKSAQVSQIVKICGIIVAASQVRAKATKITLQCRTCRHTISDQALKPGLEGFQLPRTCGAPQSGQLQRCPVDPYHIVPDKCHCVDYQTLKLQENPEDVPHGEMPRHLQLYCDRYLTDKVAPGNRVTLIGVFSIKKLFQKVANLQILNA
ncbi:unnamed protein product [Strongylus vulgaris]|uniref:DNA replication licensing factor MCM5 n=1 Tax=Strongylus vulgaris TaxID=40348 RepID=A0A3P7JRS3_STRVU|nr:unnamed protein product [Strongylus vulgaris]